MTVRFPPVADIANGGHSHIMTDHRSPAFLLFFGGIALALSAAMWLLSGESTLTWALLVIALPPLVEGAMFRQSALIGAMIYAKYPDEVERKVYQPGQALFRCCYLLCFVATVVILGRGGYDLIPDNLWLVIIIIVPLMVYFAWAGTSYWKSVTLVARRERWRSSKTGTAD